MEEKSSDNEEVLVQVVMDLTDRRPIVRNYVTDLLREGRLKITVDPDTEETFTDMEPRDNRFYYSIQLGLHLNASWVTRDIMYLDRAFSEQQFIQYKLLHEISHTFLNELLARQDADAKSLIEKCKEERANKRYLTGLVGWRLEGEGSSIERRKSHQHCRQPRVCDPLGRRRDGAHNDVSMA